MVRYLNILILRKHPNLLEYLARPVQGLEMEDDFDLESSVNDGKLMEKLANMMQENKEINYEVLLAEQLKEFYLL